MTAIRILNELQGSPNGSGRYAICSRCIHSVEKLTVHGPTIVCRRPGAAPLPIGQARAPGMPCGPVAWLASGASVGTALALERSESETSNADAWRDVAMTLKSNQGARK